MSIIDFELFGPVKRTANITKKIGKGRAQKRKISNVARGVPEVMVKISGFKKGATQARKNLEYISRNGNVELENEKGQTLSGREAVNGLFEDWNKDFSGKRGHKNQRDTMSVVLSMPPGTDPEKMKSAARTFAKETFAHNHEYVFAMHTDEAHPHIHLVVKCLGYDGRRLQVSKDDPQIWRENFASNLRNQGIEAEATPRQARGVVKRPEKQVIRHMEQGDKKREPRVPRVVASRQQQAAKELAAELKGERLPDKPWEPNILAKQNKVRGTWLKVADELEAGAVPIKHKEKPNERSRSEIQQQRRAGLYQSSISRTGRSGGSKTPASLRNLSSVAVVQQQRVPQVLLHPNAPHNLGRGGNIDHGVRRQGVGYSPDSGRRLERLDTYSGSVSQKRDMAQQIRKFVAGMPAPDTQMHTAKMRMVQAMKAHETTRKAGAPSVEPKANQDNELER